MNIDTLAGEATDLKGQFKETVGGAVGDTALRRDGIADQVTGNVRKGFGAARDFVRSRPLTTVALVAGFAVLAGLGRRRTRRA